MFASTEQQRPYTNIALTNEEYSLAKFGISDRERRPFSTNDFSHQLESYALHVIQDAPVCNAFSYFPDQGQIYIDNKKNEKLFIDPAERNGLALLGITDVVQKAAADPGHIMFLYSPPGPVVFRSGTRYDKMKPYPAGQLYLLVGMGGQRVDTLAISVSKAEEEKTLMTFLGNENTKIGFDNEKEKIEYFLTHPIMTNRNIDDFLAYLKGISDLDNFPVYKNVHQEEYKLSDVVVDLKNGWLGAIKPTITLNYQQLYNMALRSNVKYAYINILQNYFPIYSRNGVMKLGGGCGGDGIKENDLGKIEAPKSFDLLSTDFRLSTLTIEKILNENTNKDNYTDYKCPGCGTIIDGETKGSDPSTWLKKCSCGYDFSCGR